jgi:alanyl-tRNA synthetase
MARLKELDRTVRTLQETQIAYLAQDLLATASTPATKPATDGLRTVVHTSPDLDPAGLKSLAQALTAETDDVIALLACAVGDKATVLFARSAQLDGAHMGNLLRTALTHFGGRGGGRPDFAQGGGVAPEKLDEVLAFAQGILIEGMRD